MAYFFEASAMKKIFLELLPSGPQQLLRIAEMYTTAAAANQQTTAAREDSQDRDTRKCSTICFYF